MQKIQKSLIIIGLDLEDSRLFGNPIRLTRSQKCVRELKETSKIFSVAAKIKEILTTRCYLCQKVFFKKLKRKISKNSRTNLLSKNKYLTIKIK